jgi:hypothetical protein
MKAKLFTILLVFSTIITNAQDFAPIGTTWHYSYYPFIPTVITYLKIESVADTTINDVQCKKLKSTVADIFSETNYYYMYSKNDSVFFYKDNAFHLLYDFGANKGDTITLGYYKTNNGLPLKMIIDSVKTISVLGQERKIQYVTCGDGLIVEFGRQVIEGIGSTDFMFPRVDFAPEGQLRCFQENNSSVFINPFYIYNDWNKSDCEQIIVINDLDNTETNNSITLFPNPTSNNLHIRGCELSSEYKIIDTTGRYITQGILGESCIIDIKHLDNGIYFIELQNNKIKTTKQFIKR